MKDSKETLVLNEIKCILNDKYISKIFALYEIQKTIDIFVKNKQ
jgi:hypothetical protein